MLVIRLQRTGRKNDPTYRIVVAEKASAVKGKFIDSLGHYLPSRSTPVVQIEKEKLMEWVKKGAQPSNTLARLCKKNGMEGMDKFISRYVKKKSKNAPPEAPAAPAAAPAPAAEAPTPAAEPTPEASTPAPEAPAAEPAAA